MKCVVCNRLLSLLTINEIHQVSKYQMCTLDPGCNIPTLSHLIKYLYSKSLTRAMSLNVLIKKFARLSEKYRWSTYAKREKTRI